MSLRVVVSTKLGTEFILFLSLCIFLAWFIVLCRMSIYTANYLKQFKQLSCLIVSFTACLTALIFQQYRIGFRDEFK